MHVVSYKKYLPIRVLTHIHVALHVYPLLEHCINILFILYFQFPGTSWGTEKKTYIDIDTAHNVRL